MTTGHILIVSDDSEFVRSLTSLWLRETDSPSITTVSTGANRQAKSSGHELIVVGPLRESRLFRRVRPASRFRSVRGRR